jgi:hypothetical protein
MPEAAPTGGGYLWEPAGAAAAVEVGFGLVDRLGPEVMRGFGALPRRGAEVGGILLGTIERHGRPVVRLEDFEAVACGHSRGPSYLLSERELETFAEALAKHQPAPGRRRHAVGYYRSHTREALALGDDDTGLLDRLFPHPLAVCLLVKPYATRVSEACIFLRREGRFGTDPASRHFPFRRKELGGAPVLEHGGGPAADHGTSVEAPPAAAESPRGDAHAAASPRGMAQAPAARPRQGNWLWIPLTFIFLLLGVAIGFQVAAGLRELEAASRPSDPYLLGLSVVQTGENLHLAWNLDAPVLRLAQRGLLTIRDGVKTELIELSADDLGRGGVLYQNSTGNVRFRLEIYPREQTSVAETLDVQLADPTPK